MSGATSGVIDFWGWLFTEIRWATCGFCTALMGAGKAANARGNAKADMKRAESRGKVFLRRITVFTRVRRVIYSCQLPQAKADGAFWTTAMVSGNRRRREEVTPQSANNFR